MGGKRGKPFTFNPGENPDVPLEYWNVAKQHEPFRECMIDTGLLTEGNPTPVRKHPQKVSKLANLSNYTEEECEDTIKKTKSKELLLRWGNAEEREDVKELIIERLEECGHIPGD
jgi:hypothetical protein